MGDTGGRELAQQEYHPGFGPQHWKGEGRGGRKTVTNIANLTDDMYFINLQVFTYQ